MENTKIMTTYYWESDSLPQLHIKVDEALKELSMHNCNIHNVEFMPIYDFRNGTLTTSYYAYIVYEE